MTIDPRSHTPVYVQLADLLRERIEAGDLPAGAAVGSETQLMQEHGIGRDAVRMAISILRSEGLVTTNRGRGTVVREPLQKRVVELPEGTTIRARMPTANERRAMNLDEGVPVFELHGLEGGVQVLPSDEVELFYPPA
ncbi:GntR family transcriptional regulator [Micromonospora haikouensis]|uniref:GntR family transcriptional regulator n=1 Tax=Micromonospora haikouensis TaxID=686309 RepID=UPI0037A915BE